MIVISDTSAITNLAAIQRLQLLTPTLQIAQDSGVRVMPR